MQPPPRELLSWGLVAYLVMSLTDTSPGDRVSLISQLCSCSQGPWSGLFHICLHPGMGTLALCLLGVLCFLWVEFTDAGVIQTPRHKVTKMGQEVTLKCQPISGHEGLFWYSQTSVQGPKLLISFNNEAPIDDSGMPKEWFSAEISNKSLSTLKIKSTEPGDSATYLCASSIDTELHSHPLPVQKPSSFPFCLKPPVVLSKGLSCSFAKRNEWVWEPDKDRK
uniref:Ig-like domain-containing protein n=1 Tax=Mustela putorius furo TaxID=9669 RepID=M3YAZ1_MUSPF